MGVSKHECREGSPMQYQNAVTCLMRKVTWVQRRKALSECRWTDESKLLLNILNTIKPLPVNTHTWTWRWKWGRMGLMDLNRQTDLMDLANERVLDVAVWGWTDKMCTITPMMGVSCWQNLLGLCQLLIQIYTHFILDLNIRWRTWPYR